MEQIEITNVGDLYRKRAIKSSDDCIEIAVEYRNKVTEEWKAGAGGKFIPRSEYDACKKLFEGELC